MGIFRSDGDAEMRDAQREEADHRANLQAAANDSGVFDESGAMRREVVRELTQPDVSSGAAERLGSMLTKDFVLGNLTEAEVHEIKWMARQMRLELDDIHPHDGSVWQGEFGQFFFESDRALSSQTDMSQVEMEQLLFDISSRAARGRDGFATRQMNTSINVSERRDSDDDADGGWL